MVLSKHHELSQFISAPWKVPRKQNLIHTVWNTLLSSNMRLSRRTGNSYLDSLHDGSASAYQQFLQFSTPLSALTTLADPFILDTKSRKYLLITAGSLFDGLTFSHKTFRLNLSIAPWMHKPKGSSLSFPSMCHEWFGPLLQ